MTEEKEFQRYNWEQYKELLERYGYTEEQIEQVRIFRENPENEQITWEQFRFLFLNGIIKRTRKLKKIRTLYVSDDKVWYLDHHVKAYRYCGEFVNE